MSTTPTFEYFVTRLNDDINRIGEGKGNTYDFYETTSHDKDFNVNGHRVSLSFQLRIDVATKELVLLDRIEAKIIVALTMYEDENTRIEPSSRKLRSFNIKTTSETLCDQITEATAAFNVVIKDINIPAVPFDFWKYVSISMPQFDKAVASTARDNSDLIELA
ncbi:hypothetical protein UFOVP657_18 [uncultured Caudovirales phage]|uniref:Uncharacterized protein n=1 Tax=uncultured Caudovirales phage TaxID=2100421 RepID=A0A6J5MIM8_9CAUD|nr:hypothetical protein UFOVP467_16 [uncultured Caudovirales phage]CAB4155761.1 hypothetical protein UFOVP657_18 [uncultured Caudovirales phage]